MIEAWETCQVFWIRKEFNMKPLFPVLACVLLAIPCWANEADFDASGDVDAIDFAIFARAWKSHEGEPNWNPLCDISEPNDGVIDWRDVAGLGDNWCWTQIYLGIYSDGWGNMVDALTMEDEGHVSFIVYEEEPYYDPPEYYAYAYRQGFYTELYYFTGVKQYYTPLGWRIQCELDVDLDPTTAGKLNGVIFLTQWWFADSYLADADVNVLDPNTFNVVTQFHTDLQGRFAIELLPSGRPYYLEFYECDWGDECYHLEDMIIEGQYSDLAFPSVSQALKPNIYIYPQETAELEVCLVFPHGGSVTTAVPDYDDGWHIVVEPSGTINGQYDYLFYESVQPDYSQHTAGWVVAVEQLEDFFRNNMAQTGFIQREIDDFIEYWIPRLSGYPYYAIYPQYNDDLNEMIRLEFSTPPQNLIRLIYSIRGLETDSLMLPEPVIPPFARDGFTVAEWGVILY
jgi:hypothetical protein